MPKWFTPVAALCAAMFAASPLVIALGFATGEIFQPFGVGQ
mgnify:CR=1 FL=1